jgi:hypothetical protein
MVSVLDVRGGAKKKAVGKRKAGKVRAASVLKKKNGKALKRVVEHDLSEDEDENENEDKDSEGGSDEENMSEEREDYGEEGEDSDYSDDEYSRPKKRKHREKSMFDLGLETASDAMSIGMKLAKGTVKGAVDLAANKHVVEYQIFGKWRFMQEIEVKKGVFISCPATIEFLEDGTVVTVCDGQKFESEYVFKERPWPRKCGIYFQARAFQGPKDTEPVNMFYKGYFKRSIMNPNVLLIRGKVYKLAGKMFWKQQLKAGTFKATKRKYG